MKSKCFVYSALDGIGQFCGAVCLSLIITSESANNLPSFHLLLGSLLGAVLMTMPYFLLFAKETSNGKLVLCSLGSICLFFLCAVVVFVVRLSLPIVRCPSRELNNASGILIMITVGTYVLASFVLRMLIFLYLLVRNKKKQTNK